MVRPTSLATVSARPSTHDRNLHYHTMSYPVFESRHPAVPTRQHVEVWKAEASNFPAQFCVGSDGRRDRIDLIATRAAQWGWALACAKFSEFPEGWKEPSYEELKQALSVRSIFPARHPGNLP